MDTVFGMPAGGLSVALTVILAIAAGVVTVLALRNIVFLKIGARNIRRRRARSALIVVGLMLGTAIIASALLTGDTMGRTGRSSVLDSLGATDEQVTAAGSDADVGAMLDVSAAKSYVDARYATAVVERAIGDSPLVDGITPAIIEPVAAQNLSSRQTEPRVTVFAAGPERLAPFGLTDIADLRAGEVLLDDDAAEELDARIGHKLVLLAGSQAAEFEVAGIEPYQGAGSDGPVVLMPLAAGQTLLDRDDHVNYVLVSNTGGATSGVTHTDAVMALLDGGLVRSGLAADPVKQDGLDLADEQGNAFVQLFTSFGSFSMAAGILLIFLIFVMLAAERRSEMGMARAIGTQRRHLVQTFVFEGAVYDLIAAAVGALLGIGVSYVMVRVTASAFAGEGLDLRYGFSMRSLVISYAIGVLLTFAVVTLSAWRVSRLNIVAAVRDISEPIVRNRSRARWIFVGLGLAFGLMFTMSGVSGKQYMPWMVGVSLLIVSAVPLVRFLGAPDRLAYTIAGALLVVWWLLPMDLAEGVLGEMETDFSIWIASGILVVVGSTWLVTYNADVLLGGVTRVTSRIAGLAPVVKMSVVYPLRSRFRTGVTLAMFMLVVYTLVTGSTIPTAFISAFDDVDTFGGGFDVRASTAPALAVEDLQGALPQELAGSVEGVGAQSFVPLEAKQEGRGVDFESYPLRGLDDEFTTHTTYDFATMAHGYDSAADVWRAVREQPGLAVVDPYVVPRLQNFMGGVLPDFQLSGFYLEDETFDPVPVEVKDPQSGRELSVTVIGVLRDDIPMDMAGIHVSQATLTPFGDRAKPTVHHVALRPGVDAEGFADQLEKTFLANGVEAESYRDVLDDAVGSSMTFVRLIQGFMGLGLLVGVAALGVVSARAVVERRQQLGMLRAIGFQPAMIRRALLIETSFIALTAIVVGAALGLVTAYNVIADSSQQSNYANVQFAVPWLALAAVFVAVYLAALATTLAPAVRASRLYPAEALRYQ